VRTALSIASENGGGVAVARRGEFASIHYGGIEKSELSAGQCRIERTSPRTGRWTACALFLIE